MAQQVPVATVCDVLALSRSRYYRYQQQQSGAKTETCSLVQPTRPPHPRALTPAEERAVRDLLHSDRFQDMSPYEVYGTLLDEDGRYLCSVRTMYRILEKYGETSPRGRRRVRTHYRKPELLATAPLFAPVSFRKERRRRGWLWYAYRRVHGVLHKRYVGRSVGLTAERLEETAVLLNEIG